MVTPASSNSRKSRPGSRWAMKPDDDIVELEAVLHALDIGGRRRWILTSSGRPI